MLTTALYIRHAQFGDRKGQKLNENNLFFLRVRYLLEGAILGEIINKMNGCVFLSKEPSENVFS